MSARQGMGMAPATVAGAIEARVVGEVDEPLSRRGVRVIPSCHRDGAS